MQVIALESGALRLIRRAFCNDACYISGGFRNLERGVQSENFWIATPTSSTLAVRTEYLEATLALVKRLEISKKLIRECVTVPGCCCMPLLHNHLMDSCSYVRKNTMLAAKGGCICTPLTPPGSATVYLLCMKRRANLAKWKKAASTKVFPKANFPRNLFTVMTSHVGVVCPNYHR